MVTRMDALCIAMGVAFVAASVLERRQRRRREHAILEVHERMNDLALATRMEDEGYTLVAVNVNQRGQKLRANAEWN